MTLRQRIHEKLGELAQAHSGTGRLSVAVGLGTLVGSTPFYGFHVWIGAALARLFRLNQVAVLLGEQVSLPFIAPFLIFASVQVGHLTLEGDWLTLGANQMSAELAGTFFGSWLLGGLMVGLAGGLVTGGLTWMALSRLRGREQRALNDATWSGRSRGGGAGYAWYWYVLRGLGRRGGYFCLWFTIPYFMLVHRKGRKASRKWMAAVLNEKRGWFRRMLDTWRHFMVFGESIVDYLLALAGCENVFTIDHEGHHHITDAHAQGKGVILLSAHVGGRAIAGQLLQDVPINLVAWKNEAEAIQKFLASRNLTYEPKVIAINDGAFASVQIIKALRRGEVVAMLADRYRGDQTLTIDFLGKPTRFPKGPFVTAVVSGAPVVLTFNCKTSKTHQHFRAWPPKGGGKVPRAHRDQAIRELAEYYVRELESFVRAHPYQWYNFYDYWPDCGEAH